MEEVTLMRGLLQFLLFFAGILIRDNYHDSIQKHGTCSELTNQRAAIWQERCVNDIRGTIAFSQCVGGKNIAF